MDILKFVSLFIVVTFPPVAFSYVGQITTGSQNGEMINYEFNIKLARYDWIAGFQRCIFLL